MGISPVGKIYHCPGTRTRGGILLRLNNVQSVDVEEERVVAEQFVQFRNHWMVIGNHCASNWLRVCSTCAEFSFMVHSLFFALKGGRSLRVCPETLGWIAKLAQHEAN